MLLKVLISKYAAFPTFCDYMTIFAQNLFASRFF